MFMFLWSVTHSIGEFSKVPPPVILLPDNSKARSKIKVNNYLFHRENLPNFKFKGYCPNVFRKLHDQFGIDDQDYMVFLTQSLPSENEGSDGSVTSLSPMIRFCLSKKYPVGTLLTSIATSPTTISTFWSAMATCCYPVPGDVVSLWIIKTITCLWCATCLATVFLCTESVISRAP